MSTIDLPLTVETAFDAYLAAVEVFTLERTELARDNVLSCFMAYYKIRNGSSVGLEDRIEQMRAIMNQQMERS